jgi:hypothetical protein
MSERRKKPESQLRIANKSFGYGMKDQYMENNKIKNDVHVEIN